MQERQLISGCHDDSTGYNTQLLYFTCSSLSADDQRIYLISDKDGHPNVYVKDLNSGVEQRLTDNRHGILKSYVYFDGNPGRGLGKASPPGLGRRATRRDEISCRAFARRE